MASNTKEINPFRTGLIIEISEMLPKSNTIYLLEIEKHTPISVFMDHALLELLYSLTPPGKDLLFYIMQFLGNNKDTIELKYEKYCTKIPVSERTFRRAKDELINVLLIKKKSRKDVYFINPQYLFRGNRITAFPEKTTAVYTHQHVINMREMNRLPHKKVIKESTLVEDDDFTPQQ